MEVKVLNRRICTYDMVEVLRDAYTVTEEEQEIYLCICAIRDVFARRSKRTGGTS